MTPRTSRIVAVTLAGALIIGTVSAIVIPYAIRMHEASVSHRDAFARLAKARVHADERDADKKILQALEGRSFWAKVYVADKPESVMPAFQTDIRTALGARGASATLYARKTESFGKVSEIGTTLKFSMPSEAIADVLGGLTSGPRWFRIRRLKITGPATQHEDRNEPLDVEVDVVGYVIPPTGGST